MAILLVFGACALAPSPTPASIPEPAPMPESAPTPESALTPATEILCESLSHIDLVNQTDLGLTPGYSSAIESKEAGRLYEGSSEERSVLVLEGLGHREHIGEGISIWHGIAVQIYYTLFPTVEAATASFQQSKSKCKTILAENLGMGNESYRLPNMVHFRMGNVRVFVKVTDPKFGDPEIYAKIVANKMVSALP